MGFNLKKYPLNLQTSSDRVAKEMRRTSHLKRLCLRFNFLFYEKGYCNYNGYRAMHAKQCNGFCTSTIVGSS